MCLDFFLVIGSHPKDTSKLMMLISKVIGGNINDVYEQEFKQRVMARMDDRLDQFVDQLADRINEGEESKNPFFEGEGSSPEEQPGWQKRNQKEDNRR
nr:reverse transcriptase domain-containing protein [Tanacetum cinerariifolium]